MKLNICFMANSKFYASTNLMKLRCLSFTVYYSVKTYLFTLYRHTRHYYDSYNYLTHGYNFFSYEEHKE